MNSLFSSSPLIETESAVCGICFSDKSEFYANSYDFEYATCSNKWAFVKCQNCGNIYLNQRPLTKDLNIIYPKNYYSYQYETQVLWIARKAKEWLDQKKFNYIQRSLGKKINKYIDIGCGTGRYLKLMSKNINKKNIIGFELSESVVAELKSQGFSAYCGFFENTGDIEPNSVQLITLFSVLEHLPSPVRTLQKAHDILESGGMIVFEVPNPLSTNARWFKNELWGGYHTPRHWNLFDIETVKKQFLPIGYEIAQIKRSTGHAFWLWSLHHWCHKYLNGKFANLFNPSKCLPGLAFFTVFDIVRGWFNFETDNNIIFLRKK